MLKSIGFLLLALISMIGQSFASGETQVQNNEKAISFLEEFYPTLQRVLDEQNHLRSQNGKKLFCHELNDEQKNLIAQQLMENSSDSHQTVLFKDISNITISEFKAPLGDSLNCYSKIMDGYGLVEILANAKAYTLNMKLIVLTLEKMAGHKINNYETTLESVLNQE